MSHPEQKTSEYPEAQAVRRQLDKILASNHFSRSGRMSRFLRFTVERSIEGRAEELKEYLLGVEVFDRREGYDSRVDPIVRVEARRLRAKLRQYYAGDGRGDELVIEFPTGSYAPCFGPQQPAAPPETAPGNTIAVLPFTNLSAEPDYEYFSDGLTEELIHGLTKVEGLRVVAWQTAMQLKGRPLDLHEVGERLKVATVLAGSVRRSGERLRITVQLIETATGLYLWTETYDRALREIFAIQDEISWAIIHTLKIRLTGAPAAARPTPNLDAYQLYLKGRFHWNKRTVDGLRKSIPCYEQALGIDPNLAAAWAGISDSYTILAEYGMVHPSDALSKAREAAQKALALDPLLAEGHASLGLIRGEYDWEWEEAGRHYRRAIQLNPGYATAHQWYATDYLAMLGRFEEARAEIEIAHRLNPLSSIILEGRGYVRLLEGQYAQALEIYREVMELDPGFYHAIASTGRAYIQQGRYQEAIGMLQKARTLAGEMPTILGALGQAFALAGEAVQARRVLAELEALALRCYVNGSSFALVYLGLNEKQEALDWLERGCARRDLSMMSLKVHPVYDPLRSEPRFQALVQRIFGPHSTPGGK